MSEVRHGSVNVAASHFWLWVAEGHRPDVWDIAGATPCLIGANEILTVPRA